jgi:hypothetical protein
MNGIGKKAAILILSAILPLMTVASALVGSASATTASSYAFNLIGPNTSIAEATVPGTPIAAGDVLRLTGSGGFDTSTGTASGGGSFTHYKPDGSVFARGTWVVTGFQSFTSYGGPNPGTQGGVLHVTVTLFGPEATFAGLTLQVSCRVNAPTGAPDEGTTLPGLFAEPTGGHTLFHISA